uniref:Uncharacterized protein n=1 Tax=Ditylenchus dipsaci TaxID=166011 RepID=A0A915ESV6_9BILA
MYISSSFFSALFSLPCVLQISRSLLCSYCSVGLVIVVVNNKEKAMLQYLILGYVCYEIHRLSSLNPSDANAAFSHPPAPPAAADPGQAIPPPAQE